jgi:DNA-binding HxlR family transcriptional regulator
MSTRSYGDMCRFAHALDLVGERWALLVVRELVLGPKRFTDLRGGLPHASPNVLSQRLRELEEAGVIRRRTLPPPAGSKVYELTEWGQELEPIVRQLGKWGARSPNPPIDAEMGRDSIVLALGTLFEPEAAAGVDALYDLRLGVDRYVVDVRDGEIGLKRGEAQRADLSITSDPQTLGGVIGQQLPLEDALKSGALSFDGTREELDRFLSLFPLPEPADVPEPAEPVEA